MARYHVIVKSPLGERGGTLILYERGGAVTGTLSLLGVNNPVTGSREGETLTLRHTLQTALNAFACETRLRDEGAVLRGVIHIGVVHMPLQGQKIEEATEKEHQAHGTADQA